MIKTLENKLDFSKIQSSDEIYDLGDVVSDEDLIDFKTRFEYVFVEEDNKVSHSICNNFGKQNYFGKRGVVKGAPLGTLQSGSKIVSNDGIIVAVAEYQLTTIHYYNAPVFFAGTYGELVAQLPKELKIGNKPFYYFIKPGYISEHPTLGLHIVEILFFSVCL